MTDILKLKVCRLSKILSVTMMPYKLTVAHRLCIEICTMISRLQKEEGYKIRLYIYLHATNVQIYVGSSCLLSPFFFQFWVLVSRGKKVVVHEFRCKIQYIGQTLWLVTSSLSNNSVIVGTSKCGTWTEGNL